jgi:3-hydroxy-9,10-secoandrosta-1,3,5(10)-triene-9,17-dione monooxygenase reductase component
MWGERIAVPPGDADPRAFRNALGAFPTGVCIVTTRRPNGKRAGLTVSSFNAVSLNPAMVLWSLTRSSPSASTFREAEYFAVNVLAEDQRELASHFARPTEDKFAAFDASFVEGIGGLPLLEGAAARFQCSNSFQKYGGDHIVFIGTVEKHQSWARMPLVFHRGRYAKLVIVKQEVST